MGIGGSIGGKVDMIAQREEHSSGYGHRRDSAEG